MKEKTDKERQKELQDFRSIINSLDEKSFDGHTEFEKLSPKEKLLWLSELNYFKYIAKKNS